MPETPARIEPVLFDEAVPRVLADLMSSIQSEVVGLGARMPPESLAELADFTRIMNCYYSNLIEGHHTRPADIERALVEAGTVKERRPLVLEAKAHVLVQRRIDEMHRAGSLPVPTSTAFVRDVHRAFYDLMPDELRTVSKDDGTTLAIVPGEMRSHPREDVAVGRHLPPSSTVVGDFMGHFERRFGAADKSPSMRILAVATAHHRLNYIHPFVDGNGRVSRLVSHAMALRAGIGANGLWSVSRGLARGLRDRGEYRRMMEYADTPRQGSRDGRGNLSERALTDFCEWMMSTVLDQVRFARAVYDLDALEGRYRRLLDGLGCGQNARALVSHVLTVGRMERGAAHRVLGVSERTGRSVLSDLGARGFLKSETQKGAVRIAFPVAYREALFPALFTDTAVDIPEPPATSFTM